MPDSGWDIDLVKGARDSVQVIGRGAMEKKSERIITMRVHVCPSFVFLFASRVFVGSRVVVGRNDVVFFP